MTYEVFSQTNRKPLENMPMDLAEFPLSLLHKAKKRDTKVKELEMKIIWSCTKQYFKIATVTEIIEKKLIAVLFSKSLPIVFSFSSENPALYLWSDSRRLEGKFSCQQQICKHSLYAKLTQVDKSFIYNQYGKLFCIKWPLSCQIEEGRSECNVRPIYVVFV